MKKISLLLLLLLLWGESYSWGFFGHRRINRYAVFLLPPQLLAFYKPHIEYLEEHATDPDKRRYAVKEEGPRHYMDLDHYASDLPDSMPRRWDKAVKRYGEDSLNAHGIVPWWIDVMYRRLVAAFKSGEGARILRISAEIGHYLADAHVPLHASTNHNGQFTNQRGIHGFWESRLPELLADNEWDFFIGKAVYVSSPLYFAWDRLLESAAAADSVLRMEKELGQRFPEDGRFAYEERSGKLVRQYSSAYARAFDKLLGGMVERRMRQAIFAVASYWYSAWVDAGQPALQKASLTSTAEEVKEFEALNAAWLQKSIIGRSEE